MCECDPGHRVCPAHHSQITAQLDLIAEARSVGNHSLANDLSRRLHAWHGQRSVELVQFLAIVESEEVQR